MAWLRRRAAPEPLQINGWALIGLLLATASAGLVCTGLTLLIGALL